uniref:Uncharacterized protein n=1 Tax=Nomascus leucogenys TaxID=61853 RepID=A0A2I3GD46_NOMLE
MEVSRPRWTFGAPSAAWSGGEHGRAHVALPHGVHHVGGVSIRIEDEDTSKLTEQAVSLELSALNSGGAVPLVAGSTGGDVFLGGLTGGGVFGSVVYGSIETEGPLGKNQGRPRPSPGGYHRMRRGEMSGWLQASPRTYHKGRRRRNQGYASPPRICHEVEKRENSLKRDYVVPILIIFNVSLVQCNMSIKIFRKLYYFYFLMK